MSAPGIQIAAAITPFRRDAVSITLLDHERPQRRQAAPRAPARTSRPAPRSRAARGCAGKWPAFTASTFSGSMPRTRAASTEASIGSSTPSSTTTQRPADAADDLEVGPRLVVEACASTSPP